jgi:hypothetical protein
MVQNFEISDLPMAKFKKVNTAFNYLLDIALPSTAVQTVLFGASTFVRITEFQCKVRIGCLSSEEEYNSLA